MNILFPPLTHVLCFTPVLPLCSLFKLPFWCSRGRRHVCWTAALWLHPHEVCDGNRFFLGLALSSAVLESSLSLTYDTPTSSLFKTFKTEFWKYSELQIKSYIENTYSPWKSYSKTLLISFISTRFDLTSHHHQILIKMLLNHSCYMDVFFFSPAEPQPLQSESAQIKWTRGSIFMNQAVRHGSQSSGSRAWNAHFPQFHARLVQMMGTCV